MGIKKLLLRIKHEEPDWVIDTRRVREAARVLRGDAGPLLLQQATKLLVAKKATETAAARATAIKEAARVATQNIDRRSRFYQPTAAETAAEISLNSEVQNPTGRSRSPLAGVAGVFERFVALRGRLPRAAQSVATGAEYASGENTGASEGPPATLQPVAASGSSDDEAFDDVSPQVRSPPCLVFCAALGCLVQFGVTAFVARSVAQLIYGSVRLSHCCLRRTKKATPPKSPARLRW